MILQKDGIEPVIVNRCYPHKCPKRKNGHKPENHIPEDGQPVRVAEPGGQGVEPANLPHKDRTKAPFFYTAIHAIKPDPSKSPKVPKEKTRESRFFLREPADRSVITNPAAEATHIGISGTKNTETR